MKAKEERSRGSARREAYLKLAAESAEAKERRNRELETAISLGDQNVKARGEKVYITETVEIVRHGKVVGEKTRILRDENGARIFEWAGPAHVAVKLPSSTSTAGQETKAMKRLRLKSRRNRLVKDFDHSTGSCGNIGCKRCSARSYTP